MGDLVDLDDARLRRRRQELKATLTPVSDPRMYLFGTGIVTFPDMCNGFVHNFMTVPGPCNCGKNYYDDNGVISEKPRA